MTRPSFVEDLDFKSEVAVTFLQCTIMLYYMVQSQLAEDGLGENFGDFETSAFVLYGIFRIKQGVAKIMGELARREVS